MTTFCECGCGEPVAKEGNRFIVGHQHRGRKRSLKTRMLMSKTHKGRVMSDDWKAAISKAHKGIFLSDDHKAAQLKGKLREKDPLPNGWEIDKDSKMATNKECNDYLGCYVAEQILSRIFKDVQRMPPKNHGFDIICNQNFKIDIKSSATGDKQGYWQFGIFKNPIPDYFLCIAFDNRDNLIPTHLWLIPGKEINNLTVIRIYKSTLEKWLQYEQPLDKVILCCDERRGE